LRIRASHLVFGTDGVFSGWAVHRVPVDAVDRGASTTVRLQETTSGETIRNVAVLDDRIVALIDGNAGNDRVLSIPIDVGSATVLEADNLGDAAGPGLDARGPTIAWLRLLTGNNLNLAVQETTAVEPASFATQTGAPHCMAVTNTTLMWIEGGPGFAINTRSRAAPGDGLVGAGLLTDDCIDVASTGDAVVFATTSTVTLVSDAGVVELSDTAVPGAQGGEIVAVALDERFAYWVTDGTLAGQRILVRAAIDGGVEPSVIRTVTSPCGLAVDEQHLYWSECPAVGGRVARIRKP
jgi:hypothetical protein